MTKNKLIENIVLPIGDKIIGRNFIKELKRIRKIDSLSEKELKNITNKKEQKLINYTVLNVPFYKDFFKNKKKIFLKDFPIIEKNDIQNYGRKFISIPKSKLIKQFSSGSSGHQTEVYWSKKEQSLNRAIQIRWWEWGGYKLGNPVLQTGINPDRGFIKKIKDKLLNIYYFNAFYHTKKDIKKALEWASKKKNPVLAGYPSSLYLIAKYAEKNNIKIKFKTAICWGDKLFDYYKTKIKKVFLCEIFETYATAEGLMMGGQLDLEFMYQMSVHTKVEVLDENNNEVKNGEMGFAVVTNLNAFAMPLIRYKIGDLIIKLPKNKKPKKSKLHFECIEKIVGRNTDIVEISTKKLTVHSFTGILEHYPEIKQFSVKQQGLNKIIIKYIPSKIFKINVLKSVRNKLLLLFDKPIEIEFKKVDSIKTTPSGKPQIIEPKYINNN